MKSNSKSRELHDQIQMLKWSVWGLLGVFAVMTLVLTLFYAAKSDIKLPIDVSGDQLKRRYEMMGTVGDAINGILAPLIGSLAVLTTFLAFYVQFVANKAQRDDIKRERFENQFYEMLRLHKENINEIELGGKQRGRNAFVKMFEEMRLIYAHLKSISKASQLEPYQLIEVSYHHMFWGVDHESQECKHEIDESYLDISKLLSLKLAQDQSKYLNEVANGNMASRKLPCEYLHLDGKKLKKTFVLDIYPIDGHVSELAHTYRHLFQMVKYVASNGDLNWKEKYGYIKLLRAQLSNHEQVLMFFNAIWLPKETWWSDEIDGAKYRYLLDFALLKNIPFDLTRQLGPEVVGYFKAKLGDGPYYINPDEKEVTLDEKLNWLFEWRGI